MKTYMIKEIFGPTIQGEATYTGTPVMFLRFSGCNRWTGKPEHREKAVCWFCDTDFLGGMKMTALDIISSLAIESDGVRDIVISGGEPTLQLDKDLVEALNSQGYRLHLETNGSKDISEYYDLLHHVTMSPKQVIGQTKLKKCHDLKLLYPPAIPGVNPESFNDFPAKQKWLQPLDFAESKAVHTSDVLKYCYRIPGWRLSLQTHKILGVK